MLNFKQQVANGVLWSTLARVGQQFVQLGISIYLARLLAPEAFGLVGMIAVFTGFAGMFTDMGFGSALIQKSDITEQHIQSVFWLNLLSGIVFTLVLFFAAPWIVAFYNTNALQPLTKVISLNFLFMAVNAFPIRYYKRRWNFRR